MDISKKLKPDFTLQQTLIRLISSIDFFKGKWEAIPRDQRYLHELKTMATIESIGSSTRIEGAKLTDAEIAELLKHIKISKLKSRDEEEVIGYYETLDIIFENFSDLSITESNIKQLHRLLLKHSSKDQRHKGEYKNLSNKVVANYPDGTQRVIFNTTEPHLTAAVMSDLVSWMKNELNKKELHPLLITSIFIYEFLSIHPFQDGNGRLSRLLTSLLLLRSGYEFIQYISFENIVEKKKKQYYKALMEGQKDRNTKKENIESWVLFFLEAMMELTQKLETKIKIYSSKGSYMNERQKKLFKAIEDSQPLKLADLDSLFKEVSVNTLKKDLLYLKKENLIATMGKGKSTVYIVLKRPL